MIDIDAAMTDLALDIVGKTIFNADVESEASEIRDVLEAGMGVFHRFLLPGGELLWHLPLPATRRFTTARDRFDRMMLDADPKPPGSAAGSARPDRSSDRAATTRTAAAGCPSTRSETRR